MHSQFSLSFLQSVRSVLFPAFLLEDVGFLQDFLLKGLGILLHFDSESGDGSAKDTYSKKSGIGRIVDA